MAVVAKTQLKNKEGNRKRVEWDSTTKHAFLRLSSILIEIIHSQNGGDLHVQMKRQSKIAKKGGKINDNASGCT